LSVQSVEIENENFKLVIKKPEQAGPAVVTVPAGMSAPAYVYPPVGTPTMPLSAAAPAPTAPVTESAPSSQVDDPNLHKITSPMVGTFYRKPAPEKPNYVETGDKVAAEDVVCIVEAMKLMNEILAEVSGEIVEILVTDGTLVEYGQPLFLVKKNG
jgi:acetyl-CoA carboxylase biotin carboxyl carrier protein